MDTSTSGLKQDILNLGVKAVESQTAKDSLCPSLSLKHWVIGFAICAIIGLIFELLSYFLLVFAVTNIGKFALPYAIGIVCGLGSTFFLIGPWR